ncbi:enoyl-[acyl-carrier protein] reductase II [Negativicoccus succinicivorans]|uniref:Probable nitronate monooxygenase n=1 Tax=Negativicoccus succinicivorans TaxID=620903 RepID=A0A841R6A1_9FIRM|nr:nitronate monooxygenase [Negativicoccus succinicivorans]MBB6478298.1 enoyl-[acyl-carrier protein] reductase II [Negativicoccus succinicivorans]
MKTKLTELLGIRYPIIQGAMAWISESTLVSAVANAGATGVIATGGQSSAWIHEQIRKTKELTDHPFGVNLMLQAPNKDEVLEIICEEKVAFATIGAGNPVPYFEPLHRAGVKAIPVVPSVKLAKRVQEKGADALVIEGFEAGGHDGMQTTMALMTNVIPEIDIPIIVAGSIVDGRGMAAALLMGADGVQMGSRFLLAEECQVHQNSKDAIIAATDTDSVITGFTRNNNVRGLRSAFTDEYLRLEREGAADDVLTALSRGTNRLAAVDGDTVNGVVQVGQGLNRLTKIQPAKEIVDEIIHEMTERLQNAPQLLK